MRYRESVTARTLNRKASPQSLRQLLDCCVDLVVVDRSLTSNGEMRPFS